MSNQNPPPGASRRRRIAGESRGPRPWGAAETADPAEASEPPARPTKAPEPVTETGPPSGAPEPVPQSATESEQLSVPSRGQRRVSGGVLAAVGATALVLVAFAAQGFAVDGLGLGAWRTVDEQTRVEAARRTAPATAERAAAAILSYSYETLEADRDNAASFMTASYREEYLDTFGLVLDNAPDLEADVEAEVRASGVSHADPDRVAVLVFVNQTTVSTANNGEPQTALNRVVLTMQRSDGGWLVDDITSY